MNPAAKRYFEMNLAQQKQVQILLCERALQIWEQLVPNSISYVESVAGSDQELDAKLPRETLMAVIAGNDNSELEKRYLELMVALQDDDLSLPKQAEFAFYAIQNLFRAHVLNKETDSWLVPNQALSAIGEDCAVSVFESVVNGTP